MSDNQIIKSVGNVLLVDPNLVNVNTELEYPVPNYEDMYVYLDLRAERRGRTVLTSTGTGIYKQELNGLNDDVSVSFLGAKKSGNINEFTTNWHLDSFESDGFESFGIKKVTITTNSSYIPQVEVVFEDVRGMSFFNADNSPYRILFDFPPPIFTLTVKGYYGKALSYKMHIVNHTTEYNSETGSFITIAKFIALMYAPLTDILFRYVLNVPLIDSGQSLSLDKTVKPENTYEFIMKCKSLYSTISNKVSSDEESKKLELNIKKIDKIREIKNYLSGYSENGILLKVGSPHLVLKNNDFNNEQGGIREVVRLGSLQQYDGIVRNNNINRISKSDFSKRLMLGYVVGKSITIDGIGETQNRETILKIYEKFIGGYLNELKTQYGRELNTSIVTFDSNSNVENEFSTDRISYCVVDLTDFYLTLLSEENDLQTQRNVLVGSINTKINNMVQEDLGMIPTIYNVFELLMNDVDLFFSKLIDVSKSAETHHNDENNKTKILGGRYADINSHIYPFPLLINQENVGCGKITEVRTSPYNISREMRSPFPELVFVNDFINSFKKQEKAKKLLELKNILGENGTSLWIPISPIDSNISNLNPTTPYYGVDNWTGLPLNLSSDNRLAQVFNILLRRFYVASQYVQPFSFTKNSNFFAELEASNLAESVVSVQYAEMLIEACRIFNRNIDSFYDYLRVNNADVFSLNGVDINTDYVRINNKNIYKDRDDNQFESIDIVDDEVVVLGDEVVDAGGTPVFEFRKELNKEKNTILKSIKRFFGDSTDTRVSVLDKNVLFVPDYDDIEYTKYSLFRGGAISGNDLDKEITLARGGNEKSKNVGTVSRAKNSFIIEHFYKTVNGDYFDVITNVSNVNYDRRVSSIYFLSGLTRYTSPFDKTFGFNDDLFSQPLIVDVPNSYLCYLGSLVGIELDDTIYNKIISTYKNNIYSTSGPQRSVYIFRIIADIVDVNKYLSNKDKEKLVNIYEGFMANNYDQFILDLNKIKSTIQTLPLGDRESKYGDLIKNEYRETILIPFMRRRRLLIHSEISFKMSNYTPKKYLSLNEFTSNELIEGGVDNYFKVFFTKLSKFLEKNKSRLNSEDAEFTKISGDEDIITQTYYSFKNINDKWISGFNLNYTGGGYPLNEPGKKLIQSFAFVDRAMNPIGDTILNVQSLIDAMDDPDVTVFTVITQLLSNNGFEFFPLQNFMSFDVGGGQNSSDWLDSFKIDVSGTVKNSPAFVCMYIGGSSSYPSNIETLNLFKNDGILDLGDINGITDFNSSDCDGDSDSDKDRQIENNNTFPYGHVRAFRVRVGSQNQSMFNSFKFDSKEYPETNESIQILSRISGDNRAQAPIPKGQNLYNLYENRSYSTTVNGLGNVMIQPTQYFQIENVPMYNGAYIILSVTHTLDSNRMTTDFTGTKILKYPMPRVKSAASIFGIDDGSTAFSNINEFSENTITQSGSSGTLPIAAKINTLHTLLI